MESPAAAPGSLPIVTSGDTEHTATPINVYGLGVGAEQLETGRVEVNSDIFGLIAHG